MTSRRILFVVVFAFAHVAATVCIALLAYGAIFTNWDSGPSDPTTAEAVFGIALRIVTFPLALLGELNVSGPLGYLVLYGNGLVWGIALVAAWTKLHVRP